MNKTTFFFISTALFLYLIMGTKKAFGKVTEKNIFRGCDKNWGCGNFGASRSGGTRKHNGLDIKTEVNEVILSPISGKITRYPMPYSDDAKYKGIEIVNDDYLVKIFYMIASVPIGSVVKQGQPIGNSQNIASKYGASMTNHIHLEVYDKNRKLINPEQFYK